MTEEKSYLTEEGKVELERELEKLVTVDRPALAVKLKEAVAQGDLKENADYHDAKEQQAFIEGRIQRLETILRNVEIINSDGTSDVVQIGSEVTIREDGMDDDETYMIVGVAEANPREGKISHESSVGSALIGHKKGDKVRVQTPSGEIVFKIKKIR